MFIKNIDKILKKFNTIFENYGYKFILISLMFILLYIFFHNINVSLDFDELWNTANTGKELSLAQMIYESSIKDIWPPLYYILLHYIQVLFGNTETYLRIISIISNILSLFMLYIFTKKLYSKYEAILACIFFSYSHFLKMYAITVKGYSLLLFLSICSFYFLVNFLQDDKKSSLLIFFCFSFLCSLVHYFGIYLTLFQIIYLIINKKDFLKIYYIPTILFLLILFLYPIFHYTATTTSYGIKDIGFFEHNASFNEHFNRKTFIFKEFIPSLTFNLFNNPVEQILLFCSIIYCFIKIKLRNNKFLLYFIILPLLFLLLESSVFKSFLETRFLIFLFPLIYILMSYFIKSIIPNKIFNIVLIFIFVLFILNLKTDDITMNDDREQILFVKNDINNLQEAIFVHEKNYNIEYYLDRFMLNSKILPVQWNPDIERIKETIQNYQNVYIIYEFEESALKYKQNLEKYFNLEQKTKQIFLLKTKENIDI